MSGVLTENEPDPINWDGDVCEDHKEPKNVELLYSNKSICQRKRFPHLQWWGITTLTPVELPSPSISEEINPVLTK